MRENMRKQLIAALMCAWGAGSAFPALVDFVNPMIGTQSQRGSLVGNTLPGPVWPFGMVQPGPDTAVNAKTGDYGSHESGYNADSTRLMGFTQTHLSGTGCCDLQDFLLLPFVGDFPGGTNRFLVAIDKTTERASPGYYAVSFRDQPVKAELTCSRRVAYHRYTFPRGGRAHVFVDLQAGPLAWWRMTEPDYPKNRVIASEASVSEEGIVEAQNIVTCWNDNRRIACKIAFSPRPVAVRELPANGRAGKRWVMDFDLPADGCVVAKAAVSGVDVAGARSNFASDPDTFDFDARRTDCAAAWENLLSRVRAEGSDAELRTFYTALYHAFVQPSLLSDADGRVRFGDNRRPNESKVVEAKGFDAYTTFSEWDTFRAAHPLYTIVTPRLVGDFAKSMLATCRAVGMLPKWQMFGGENYCMVGVHSIPVLADAVLKGLTDIPPCDLLAAARASLARDRDEALYDRLGYAVGRAGVSSTLEWGIDDWATARLAERAGNAEAERLYDRRAAYYRNLFDVTSGCFRARNEDGSWRTPFDPYQERPQEGETAWPYTEGGAYQYACHVLQDVPGLVALHGGAERFAGFLDTVFGPTPERARKLQAPECSGRIGQFALGDEHDQHVPYLWQYAGRPDRTAEIVRDLCRKYYTDRPDGLCGNDDCGQTSAWYVFACLGFYPVNPCGGNYVLGAPQLSRIELRQENGRAFIVRAQDLSDANRYVRSVTLNGRRLDGFVLRHEDIVRGGELVFEMTAERKTGKGD